MNIDLTEIQNKVRAVLKSIGTMKPGAPAQAAEPPEDPDSLDQRLEGAAPTEDGMAAAGAEAAAGQQAAEPPAGEDGGSAADPDPDGDPDGDGDGDGDADGDGDGRPVAKSLAGDDGSDGFGNMDLTEEQIRSLEKSYGNGTGKAEPSELLKGGPDLQQVLEMILQGFEDQQIVLQALHDEIATLKAGQTATNRKVSKALAEFRPEAHIEAPPTVIAAPKAVTRVAVKALDGGPGAPVIPLLTPDQIFAQMKAGTLSQNDAISAARQSRTAL